MIFRETELCILAYPPSNITMIQIPRPDSKQEAENYDEDTVKLIQGTIILLYFYCRTILFWIDYQRSAGKNIWLLLNKPKEDVPHVPWWSYQIRYSRQSFIYAFIIVENSVYISIIQPSHSKSIIVLLLT